MSRTLTRPAVLPKWLHFDTIMYHYSRIRVRLRSNQTTIPGRYSYYSYYLYSLNRTEIWKPKIKIKETRDRRRSCFCAWSIGRGNDCFTMLIVEIGVFNIIIIIMLWAWAHTHTFHRDGVNYCGFEVRIEVPTRDRILGLCSRAILNTTRVM